VDVAGVWSILHNEEPGNIYISPNNIRLIRSRRLRSSAHKSRMEEMRNTYKILFGKPE
jgi:hypothetical protein